MIVGTAGHVDHGKTSLVRALTGVDTDRLAEEKRRGITIELGFAYAHLDDGAPTGAPRIGFVDVPGHHRFVQTMIAGAAGIDVGLLVVAADDGPMPQTREHVDILAWLGVDHLVVALTKVDAVDAARVGAAHLEVRALLDTTRYRGAPVVPVSVIDGSGIEALRNALRAHAASPEFDEDSGVADARAFRLAIDRVFVLRGSGLVVTGTCSAGRVAIDDTVTLLSSRLTARVRGIHAQAEAVAGAGAGQRVALNLVGRGVETDHVHRGDWAVAASLARETTRVDVALDARAAERFDPKTWRTVRFHAGAAAVGARVVLLEPAAHDEAVLLAQVVFDRPLHVVAGDRFVLRDGTISSSTTPDDTPTGSVAGGIVLDVDVPTRGRRGDARLAFLRVAATGDERATLAHAIASSARGIDLAHWNAGRNTTFAASDTDALRVGALLFSAARRDALLERLTTVLADEHARAPDTVGPGRDRLRRMALPALDATTFGELVDDAKKAGRVAQTGAWLHLPAHRAATSPEDRGRFERARPLLVDAAEPNNPPRVRDLARTLGDDEAAMRGTLARLATAGEVYRVAHDHYFPAATVRRLAGIAAGLCADEGVARAAAFRDRVAVGRKVAIQILEFFDRVGYTRRVGDDHRVIQPALFDE